MITVVTRNNPAHKKDLFQGLQTEAEGLAPGPHGLYITVITVMSLFSFTAEKDGEAGN